MKHPFNFYPLHKRWVKVNGVEGARAAAEPPPAANKAARKALKEEKEPTSPNISLTECLVARDA